MRLRHLIRIIVDRRGGIIVDSVDRRVASVIKDNGVIDSWR